MSAKNIRLIVVLVVVVMILGLGGWYIWYILNTGVLNVSAEDSKATIQLSNSLAKQTTLSKNGKASARLSPGVYTVTAISGDKQTRTTVEIQKQQTINASLKFEDIRPTSTVIMADAQGVQGNGGSIRYLNVPVQKPYQFTPTFIDPTPYAPDAWRVIASLNNMSWFADNQALVKNTYGDYFLLQNGLANQLVQQSRANQDANEVVVHDVAVNSQGHLASAIKNDVFYQTGPNAELVAVASLRDGVANVDISGNDMLLYYLQSGSEVDKNHDYKIHLVQMPNKQEVVIENTEPVKTTVWSNDGKNLLYSTSSGIYVYNLETKQRQVVFPNNSPALQFLAWAGSDQALYADDQSFWQYNLNTHIAHRLAGYTGGASLLQDLTTSLDGKLIYYSIAPSNAGGVVGGVFSIPLK